MAAEKIPITLTLTQRTYDVLAATVKDQPVERTLAGRAEVLLENIATGGMVLSPDQVRNIENVTGKEINRGADIVAAVQAANDMEENSFVHKVTVDPIWKEPLEQKAVETGRTVDQLLTDAVAIGFENNWIYGMVPDNPPIFFTNADLAYWQRETGKPRPSGADVTAAAKRETVAA